MKQWLLLAVASALANTGLAQPAQAAGQVTAPLSTMQQEQRSAIPLRPWEKRLAASKFSMAMLESGRIDPDYPGLPLGVAVAAIQKFVADKKGEFESTADYQRRKAAALDEKIIGNSSLNDWFAFTTPVKKNGQSSNAIGYEFNADTGKVKLFVLPYSFELNGIGAPDYAANKLRYNGLDQFELSSKLNSKGPYKGAGSYRAKYPIEETSTTRLGIAVNRIPFLDFKRDNFHSTKKPAIQLTMENAVAEKELPALKALLVMKVASPYLVYNFYQSEFTPDRTDMKTIQSIYLAGNMAGIIFYSGITGEILGRLPAGFGLPAAGQAMHEKAAPAAQ